MGLSLVFRFLLVSDVARLCLERETVDTPWMQGGVSR